mmetsp:Transcript_38464/g.90455  ORF Transcript_38464/g.90455 Transcript_38464/m.90455 type:complete len:152 (+) Transcript_38464:322-777(+)
MAVRDVLAHGGMHPLRDDFAFMMRLVQMDPYLLRFASRRLQDNDELVMTAILLNGDVLEHASPRLRSTESFVRTALRTAEAATARLNILMHIPNGALRRRIQTEAVEPEEEPDSDGELSEGSTADLDSLASQDFSSVASSDFSSSDEEDDD